MSKKFYFSIVFVICIFCNSLGQEKRTIIRGTTLIKGYNEIAFAGFEENPISDIGKEYIVQPDSNNCFHLNISLAHFTEVWIQFGLGTKNHLSKQIYLFPGDELKINISELGLSFYGKGAEKNNLYNVIEEKGLSEKQLTNPLMYNQITIEEYIEKIKDFKEQRNQLLEQYQKVNSLEKEFIDFYKKQTEIEYRDLIQQFRVENNIVDN